MTLHRPKPLVPICGVPLLSYALSLCARHGLTDVVVNAHWLSGQLQAWAGEREGCSVHVSVEHPEILGTGGGLKTVQADLAEQFVILNGDVLHNIDLTALLEAVPSGGGALALRVDPENAATYGIVASDETGTVVRIRDFAVGVSRGDVDRSTHFTGIHALDRAALDLVPDGFCGILRTAHVQLVPQRLVGSVKYRGTWLDAGDPRMYLDTNLAVLSGEIRFDLDPMGRAGFAIDPSGDVLGDRELASGAKVDGPVWIGRNARIKPGVRIARSIVGEGAIVEGDLIDSVVWDGARVPPGEHRRVVVHDGGVLQVT
jgi:mannose-1-phosphate guanylyltransferase